MNNSIYNEEGVSTASNGIGTKELWSAGIVLSLAIYALFTYFEKRRQGVLNLTRESEEVGLEVGHLPIYRVPGAEGR